MVGGTTGGGFVGAVVGPPGVGVGSPAELHSHDELHP